MQHLLNSCVEVYRLEMTAVGGRPRNEFVKQPGQVLCRIDVTFTRPGKDQPMPFEAGKAPDRVGVLFCMGHEDLRAGDLLKTVPNRYGEVPISGTWEVRVVPDKAQGFWGPHHIEVQVVETAQQLGTPVFPGSV